LKGVVSARARTEVFDLGRRLIELGDDFTIMRPGLTHFFCLTRTQALKSPTRIIISGPDSLMTILERI